MCLCLCRCSYLSITLHISFLSTIVHVSNLLWACAWSSAGAQACACVRAGAGVRLLQHSFRCLSATITVATAYFSPPRFLRVTGYNFLFFYFFFLLIYYYYFFYTDLPLIWILILVASLYLDCTG